MFDTLVESTNRQSGRRTGRWFVATFSFYLAAVVSIGLLGIYGLTPVLADQAYLLAALTPPVVVTNQPLPVRPSPRSNAKYVDRELFRLNQEPNEIAPPDLVLNLPPRFVGGPPASAEPGVVLGSVPGIVGNSDGPPPPPPTPTPAPPTPTPEVKQGPNKVSEGVLQGKAIRKVMPPYPPIAKAAHVSGQVQVLVLISEDGRVIEARSINGHPLLRPAAESSARQWIFSPTLLSQVPVKVQGLLTFDFKLE
ncbi:MAG TPA: energy transducer TonB [Blastocatellia bacterium]|nr:energy transducer TonB [Blastocatellia bacterium]